MYESSLCRIDSLLCTGLIALAKRCVQYHGNIADDECEFDGEDNRLLEFKQHKQEVQRQ